MIFQAPKIRLIMTLRQQGIQDTNVLSAIERVDRHAFVSNTFSDQAYDDTALPIGLDQTISQPYVVARMTEALELKKDSKVLEIGTGSGYQAAILAQLCRRVYTIERFRNLLAVAEGRFRDLGIRNIVSICADGMKGWPAQAPFDRIIVTAAAVGAAPQALLDQLAVGGIMVIPIGTDPAYQNLVKITRLGENEYKHENLLKVRFVPLLPDTSNAKMDTDTGFSSHDAGSVRGAR